MKVTSVDGTEGMIDLKVGGTGSIGRDGTGTTTFMVPGWAQGIVETWRLGVKNTSLTIHRFLAGHQ